MTFETQKAHMLRPVIRPGDRILCWFSCGAASAVATKITLETFNTVGPFGWTNEVIPVYCDTSKSEHPDNIRFIADCEEWFQKPIMRLVSDFSTVEQVFAVKRYMSGIQGATCTVALKKVPRFQFAKPDDIHVFGFTYDEVNRIHDFSLRNCELHLLWILWHEQITKQDCYARLTEAGIELPEMYKLGYKNNNCLGCVKATSPGYWQKIRHDFPGTFAARAKQSRDIGCRLVRVDGKRIFLDELPEDRVFPYKRENISCGPECGTSVQTEMENV